MIVTLICLHSPVLKHWNSRFKLKRLTSLSPKDLVIFPAVQMKVEKVACQTHITALHYHLDRLYVGVGQDLEIYALSVDQPPSRPIKFHVFDCFSIHGISVYVNEGLFVAVHGDRFCSLYQLIESHSTESHSTETALKLVKDKINFYDWILELQLKDGRIYALLTSCRLGIFDLETNQCKIISCPEKFTLYAAKLLEGFSPVNLGNNRVEDLSDNRLNNDRLNNQVNDRGKDRINVAAGTVFSEILICSYSDTDCTITERLVGHDGALFSIDYRPQLLASASDDRTVRLWSRASGRFVCTHVLYGHESRIWQVKLTSHCIISIGKHFNRMANIKR